jgi:hypothetical protein
MFKIIFAIIVGGLGTVMGYGVGWTVGIAVSATTSSATGMCTAIDAGVSQGLFKDGQLGQIGAGMAQLRQKRGQPTEEMKSTLQIKSFNPSSACQKFREGMYKASS